MSTNLGFAEIAYKIYNVHRNDIDNINEAISANEWKVKTTS